MGVPQATTFGVITLQSGGVTIIEDSTLPQIAFLLSLLSSEPSIIVTSQRLEFDLSYKSQ